MVRSFLLLLPATLLPRLSALFVSLVGANILTTTEFGYFALVVVVGEASESSALGWIRVLLLRYGSEKDGLSRPNAKRLTGVALVGTTVAFITAAALCWFAAGGRSSELFIATVGYIFAFSLLRFGLIFLQIQNRNKLYSIIEGIRGLSYVVITTITMANTGSFLLSSLMGSASVGAFGLLAFSLGWRETTNGKSASIQWWKIHQAGVPIFLTLVLGSVVSSLDKVVLGHVFTKEIIAAYAVAFALGRQCFDVIAYTVNIGYFSELIRDSHETVADAARFRLCRAFSLIIAVSLPVAAALIASSKLIAAILVPPPYWDAIESALPIIVVGAIMLNIKNNVFDNVFHLAEKNYYQLPTIALGAGASLLFAFLSPHSDPYVAAALIFFSGSSTSLILAVAFSRLILAVDMNWPSIASSIAISILTYAVIYFCEYHKFSLMLNVFTVACVGVGSVALSLIAFRYFDPMRHK